MVHSSNWLGHSPFTGELTGSSPVWTTNILKKNISRGRAVVACWAHNPKVGGSNPPPATMIGNPNQI